MSNIRAYAKVLKGREHDTFYVHSSLYIKYRGRIEIGTANYSTRRPEPLLIYAFDRELTLFK
jgi:hypothetical protein